MATLSPSPKLQIIDSAGAPIVGALLYTYDAGTSTPKATYTDSTGDTPNTNPVVSDASGYVAVWLGTGAYKFILTDGVDATIFDPNTIEGTTIYTVDNISSAGGGSGGSVQIVETIAALKALDEGSGNDVVIVLGYYVAGDGGGGLFRWNDTSSETNDNGIIITPTSTTGAGRWYRQIGQEINPRWYGARGTGTDNDRTAFAGANTFCATGNYILSADAGTYLWSTDPSLTAPIKLSPNAILKWGAFSPSINAVIDWSDNSKHFDSSNIPVLPDGMKVKPQWWGAVGDGTTDDTVAMNMAAASVPDGGILFVPGTADSYLVGNASNYIIETHDNMTIIGEGESSLLKVKDSMNSAYAIIGHGVASQLQNVKIEKIAIDGNQANNTTAGTGIELNSLGGYIRDCTVYDFDTAGIKSYGQYFTIENNSVVDCKNFIYIAQADHTVVRNNNLTATVATDLATIGIFVYPTANADIIDTDIVGNVCVGVPILCTAIPETPTTITSLNIFENTVDLSRTGLGGYNGPNCIAVNDVIGYCNVSRNIVFTQAAQTGGGLRIGGTSVRDAQYEISDNIVRMATADVGTSHNGINLFNINGAVVKGNNVRCSAGSSSDFGIAEAGTCTNIDYGVNDITGFDQGTFPKITIKIGERLGLTDSGTITGAANLVLGAGNLNTIDTTAATVNLIDSTGWTAGAVAVLEFTGSITIKHNYAASTVYKPVIFKSAIDFVSSSKKTLIIKYNGTSWYEVLTVGDSILGTGLPMETINSAESLDITLTTNMFLVDGTTDVAYIKTTGRTVGAIIYIKAISSFDLISLGASPGAGYAKINLGYIAATPDLEAGDICSLIYDGTVWNLLSTTAA